LNELGGAVADGSAVRTGVALAGMLPLGRVAGKADDAFGLIVKYVGEDAVGQLNKHGDLILESKDGLRQVRFDVNHPQPHRSPHAHVVEYRNTKNGKERIYNERVYPRDVPPE
jgi:hypothetical protein